jgi:hypothetical protein
MMAVRWAETALGSGMYRRYPGPTVTTAWTLGAVRVVGHHGGRGISDAGYFASRNRVRTVTAGIREFFAWMTFYLSSNPPNKNPEDCHSSPSPCAYSGRVKISSTERN